jgi:hypothetical protein
MEVEVKGLHKQASKRLVRLRNAISSILRALPVSIDQPCNVYRTLSIDRMLGWKLFKIYELEDIFLAAQYIPRKAAFGSFLKASAANGISPPLLDEARQAFDEFTALVDVHAGDRSSLELMLLAFSEDGLIQVYREQQKAAFHANRFIYGLEARVEFFTQFVSPSSDKRYLDITHIKGFVDMRRNRPNVSWCYEHPLTRKRSGTIEPPDFDRPLVNPEELPGDGSIPWYPEFCSCEFPDVEKHLDSVDYLQEIFPDSTGKTALMTLVFANHYRTENQMDFEEGDGTSLKISTPVETLVMDMFIDRDLLNRPELQLRVFTDVDYRGCPHVPGYLRSQRERLPTDSSVRFMGRGISASYLHEVRRYEEILRDAFSRRGLDDTKYDLYRVKLEYPVIPSTIAVIWEP